MYRIRPGTSHTEKENIQEIPFPYLQNIHPHIFVDCYTAVTHFVCLRKKMELAFGMDNATRTKKVKLRTAIIEQRLQSWKMKPDWRS
jgi:hypothetical protein